MDAYQDLLKNKDRYELLAKEKEVEHIAIPDFFKDEPHILINILGYIFIGIAVGHSVISQSTVISFFGGLLWPITILFIDDRTLGVSAICLTFTAHFIVYSTIFLIDNRNKKIDRGINNKISSAKYALHELAYDKACACPKCDGTGMCVCEERIEYFLWESDEVWESEEKTSRMGPYKTSEISRTEPYSKFHKECREKISGLYGGESDENAWRMLMKECKNLGFKLMSAYIYEEYKAKHPDDFDERPSPQPGDKRESYRIRTCPYCEGKRIVYCKYNNDDTGKMIIKPIVCSEVRRFEQGDTDNAKKNYQLKYEDINMSLQDFDKITLPRASIKSNDEINSIIDDPVGISRAANHLAKKVADNP